MPQKQDIILYNGIYKMIYMAVNWCLNWCICTGSTKATYLTKYYSFLFCEEGDISDELGSQVRTKIRAENVVAWPYK